MAVSLHGRHWPKAEDHGDEPDSTPIGEHTHRQPRVAFMGLTAMVVLLLVSNALTLMYGVSVNTRLGQLESYIADARDRRDQQNQDLSDRINRATCDVLDQLPAGELLDPTRREYGCGPGIPIEQLSPEASQNLADIVEQGQAAPAASVAPEPTTEALPPELDPQPAPGAQIVPSVPHVPTQAAPQPAPTTPAPQPAPGTPAPAAPTTPPPIVDLGPVTDTVCGLLRVCL